MKDTDASTTKRAISLVLALCVAVSFGGVAAVGGVAAGGEDVSAGDAALDDGGDCVETTEGSVCIGDEVTVGGTDTVETVVRCTVGFVAAVATGSPWSPCPVAVP